jgi:hypothetical protein
MTGALSTLLEDVLDYAGLFPPAGLGMPNAVAEYERHLAQDTIGMLAGFVCPASRLDELARNAGGRNWNLSILGTNADSASEALTFVNDDMHRIESFMSANRGFTLAALEVRIPPTLLGSPHLEELPRVVEMLFRVQPEPNVFYECAWNAPWQTAFTALQRGGRSIKVKIRTGGLEASAFPTSEQLATFMIAAREARMPWKATAGLHHPVRRFQREVGAKMHGFLNVFLSAALAWKGGDEGTLVELLNEEDRSAFRFEENRALWRDHVLDRGLLKRTRTEFALSFGSCSYREPIDDLRELDLL